MALNRTHYTAAVALLVAVVILLAAGLGIPNLGGQSPGNATDGDATPTATTVATGTGNGGDATGTVDVGTSDAGTVDTGTAPSGTSGDSTNDGATTDSTGDGATAEPNGQARTTGSADGSPTDGTPQPSVEEPRTVAFDIDVERVSSCGTTCRDVTVQLTNTGDARATGVSVETVILTGGERIWSDRERVGSLPAGESYRTTKRISLGFGEALQLRNNDGRITIRTTIRSDQRTVTVTERRDVL